MRTKVFYLFILFISVILISNCGGLLSMKPFKMVNTNNKTYNYLKTEFSEFEKQISYLNYYQHKDYLDLLKIDNQLYKYQDHRFIGIKLIFKKFIMPEYDIQQFFKHSRIDISDKNGNYLFERSISVAFGVNTRVNNKLVGVDTAFVWLIKLNKPVTTVDNNNLPIQLTIKYPNGYKEVYDISPGSSYYMEYYKAKFTDKKAFHSNGHLKMKMVYKDGILYQKLIYNRNGKLHGISIGYYPNSTIRIKWPFKNGKKNGLTKIYYPNGKIKQIVPYRYGKAHGIAKHYYKNGKIKSTGRYINGKAHGAHKFYYRNGKLKKINHFRNGNLHGTNKGYYPNGKLKWIKSFKNGKGHGTFKTYDKNGRLRSKEIYKNGIKVKGIYQ